MEAQAGPVQKISIKLSNTRKKLSKERKTCINTIKTWLRKSDFKLKKGVKMSEMFKVNLLGNLGPITEKPSVAKKRSMRKINKKAAKNDSPDTSDEEVTQPEIRTIHWCGCGNHPINPKKDPYKQHNNWAAQFHSKMESGKTDIRNVKGVGFSKKTPAKPSYDFSGDEFEVTNGELRKFKHEK